LIPANVLAWLVAVSGSYVMHCFITFAAESGRQLRWRAYGAFVAFGVVGLKRESVPCHYLPEEAPEELSSRILIFLGETRVRSRLTQKKWRRSHAGQNCA
jgi:hypothetical protein